MFKILICICSNNLSKLNKTLKSIYKLKTNNKIKLELLVIENSKKSNLKTIIKKIGNNKKIKKNYYLEKKLGIPYARNKALIEAKKIKSDYICFFDDGSIIPRNWILNNLEVINKFKNCSIVSGPQISSKKNIYKKILEPSFKHLEKIKWCATNNVLFKYNIIKKENIIFDTRLNYIGGSDQLFFKKLNLKKYEIRWNKKSYVYETDQSNRNNFSWFIKRNFRYGTSGILIDIFCYGIFVGGLINFLKSIYYLFLSIFYLILIPINVKFNLLYFIQYFSRSLFRILGLFGIFPKKYI